MEIVIINGVGGSGKDEFVRQVQSLIGEFRCVNYSTVDFVKFVAICAGWKEDKTPKNRAFLSNLKKTLADWDDVPYKKTVREIERTREEAEKYNRLDSTVMFIHCREPEEIGRFVDEFDAHTVLVTRDAAEETEQSNDSDRNVWNYNYDIIVDNNGSIEELREAAETYLREELGLEF